MKVAQVRRIVRFVITCPSCGYTWVPRSERPKVCSRCKCWLDWSAVDVQGGDAPSPKA